MAFKKRLFSGEDLKNMTMLYNKIDCLLICLFRSKYLQMCLDMIRLINITLYSYYVKPKFNTIICQKP